jgi:hypothetical protein
MCSRFDQQTEIHYLLDFSMDLYIDIKIPKNGCTTLGAWIVSDQHLLYRAFRLRTMPIPKLNCTSQLDDIFLFDMIE